MDPKPLPSLPFPKLVEARFSERPNRFIVHAQLPDGSPARCHLADPGRLREILVPGRRLLLRPADSPARKTRWSVTLAQRPDEKGWVSLDTGLPNRLVEAALKESGLPELPGTLLRREAQVGRSRLDFLLEPPEGGQLALEVKSVGWVAGTQGLFPDAPTARGVRHLEELIELSGKPGWGAALLFVVQRSDAESVTAAGEVDPAFASMLQKARQAGVLLLARKCEVSPSEISLGDPIPVQSIHP